MSKSGQPSAKADSGGQRLPKSGDDSTGSDKKAAKKSPPAKKSQAKKSGT